MKRSETNVVMGTAVGIVPIRKGRGRPTAHLLRVGSEPVALGQDPVRPADDQLSLRGHTPEPASALHDRYVELDLQLADPGRQGRLADEAGLGRSGEVALPRKGSDVLQLSKQDLTAYRTRPGAIVRQQSSTGRRCASRAPCGGL
jgi:hypothetical protein